MINNLSGHGVQDHTINQQAKQTALPEVTDSGTTKVAAVDKTATTPSTIVTLGASADEPASDGA